MRNNSFNIPHVFFYRGLQTLNLLRSKSKQSLNSACTMALKNLLDLPVTEQQSFMNSFDTVLTDCDGVLWMENKVVDGAPEVMNKFKDLGKKVFYVTNNSTRMTEDFVKKAVSMGFNCEKHEMITAAYLAAYYLKEQGVKKAYVFGTEGITKELERVGIASFGPGPDDTPTGSLGNTVHNLQLDKDVDAVVVGFDPYISYVKIMKAASYISRPGCHFVATNTDENFPVEEKNIMVPGTGTMVQAVSTCSGRKPLVVGKPNPYIVDAIIKEHNIDPARTLMIGDRCNTDILLGKNCGFKTLLVLTGVTTLNAAQKLAESKEGQSMLPDVYVETIGDLVPLIQ